MKEQIVGEQIKAARALLRMTQTDLSEASGISVRLLKKIEGRAGGGIAAVTPVYVAPVVASLKAAGVVFGPGIAVRLQDLTR